MPRNPREVCERQLKGPVVIAHRGFSDGSPDNSIEAYRRAINARVDLIEIDVRVSGDEQLFACHDARIGGLRVADMNSGELGLAGVLVLESALRAVRDSRIPVLFDIKTADTESVLQTLDLARTHKMEDQVVFGVRNLEQLVALRGESAAVPVLGFINDYTRFPEFYNLGGDVARVWEWELTDETLSLVRSGNHPVWVTPELEKGNGNQGDVSDRRLERLYLKDIDGVLVNNPKQAQAVRRQIFGDSRKPKRDLQDYPVLKI